MINLLPTEEKKRISSQRQKKIILTLGFILLVFLVVLSLILYSAKIYIQSQAEYQESLLKIQKKKKETTKIGTIESEFKKYNVKISRINAFYESQEKVSDVFKEIPEVFPSGIYLSSFSYRKLEPKKGQEKKYEAQVSMSGFSPTRKKLLNLVTENLREKEEWKDVFSPTSNWVQGEENVKFNLNFKTVK